MDRAKFKRQALLGVVLLTIAAAALALIRGDWSMLPIAGFYAVATSTRYLLWGRFDAGLHPPDESTLQWLRKARSRRDA